MNQRAAVSFGKPSAFTIFDMPVSYSVGFNWQRSYKTSYFGEGNDSSKSNQSNYDLFDINTGVNMVFEPIENFSVSPHIAYDSALAQNSDGDGNPPVGSVFPASETAGLSTPNNTWIWDLGSLMIRGTGSTCLKEEAFARSPITIFSTSTTAAHLMTSFSWISASI
jgi:hypothetical protein